ncbi:hypothetical protein [Tessaracoccus sp.]
MTGDISMVGGSIAGPKGPILTATQTRVVDGVVLPWVHRKPYPPDAGAELGRGEVFIAMSTLDNLAEQDVWDSQFGQPFMLGANEGQALEQAGLAVRETRGGYHRAGGLRGFLERMGRM